MYQVIDEKLRVLVESIEAEPSQMAGPLQSTTLTVKTNWECALLRLKKLSVSKMRGKKCFIKRYKFPLRRKNV